ncbi:MAG: helix-turn-helix domain-containing protein [Thermoleophilia bacterium]
MPDRVGVVEWRRALIASSGLPSSARLVALVLAEHMTLAGDRCFPSVALLCNETGLARSTVQEQLALLEQHGWVLRIERPGTSSTYLAAVPDVEGARSPGRWVPDQRAGGARSPGRGCPTSGHEVPTEVPTEQQQRAPAPAIEPEAPSVAALHVAAAFERAFGRPARLRREQLARLEGVLDRVGLDQALQLIRRRRELGARPNCLAWFLPALEELAASEPPVDEVGAETMQESLRAELWVRSVGWRHADWEDVELELRARGLDQADVDRLLALASELRASQGVSA